MSMDGFVEVYDVNTGKKLRVPPHFLNDPVLGVNIRKTPSQRALDEELEQPPAGDPKLTELRAYADEVGIDTTGMSKKEQLHEAIAAAFGPELPPMVKPDPPVEDTGESDDADADADDPTSTDDTESPDETPATGADEGVN